eukprot:TRINITY_DN8742_c0_g1_i1.p1 TRINITY_DN8742_c0_g1~~TRINITY_DN8742_c0_g1_i1.p1  ORF type:complete len:100 (+),score=18.62 TRINITY_DN8742_c0_g1_i1:433-732(+)
MRDQALQLRARSRQGLLPCGDPAARHTLRISPASDDGTCTERHCIAYVGAKAMLEVAGGIAVSANLQEHVGAKILPTLKSHRLWRKRDRSGCSWSALYV